MVVISKPWPHIIIDDYYDSETFKIIQSESRKFLRANVDVTTRKQEFPFADSSALQEAINSRTLSADLLRFFPEHRPFDDLEVFWELNFLLGPHEYPIHDEASRKILSSVVYVDPEDNNGTTLYNQDKTYHSDVEWKPNRAFIFAGVKGLTWHSYNCPKGKLRTTINQFLCRPRLNDQPAS